MRVKLVFGLAVVWAALFVVSIVVGLTLAPTGVGFLRGINRAIAVVGWQGAAAASALILAVLALGIERPRGRLMSILGFGPLVVTGLLVLGMALLIAWFAFFSTSPAPATGPTLPVTEAPPPTTKVAPPTTQAPG
ncbi:MAG: hypothetical protein GXP01_09455 [Alphaproteobacteria bacterium]|nr:hypothetical protein [Alphaproteobacteria bacterium]